MNGCYLLVDLDADGALGNVPDLSSAAVVELVRHSLVDGAVDLDVDVFTDLEGSQVGRERYVPLLPEGPSEQISGPRTKTVTSRHVCSLPLSHTHSSGRGGYGCGS
jgi:hypothetical protein